MKKVESIVTAISFACLGIIIPIIVLMSVSTQSTASAVNMTDTVPIVTASIVEEDEPAKSSVTSPTPARMSCRDYLAENSLEYEQWIKEQETSNKDEPSSDELSEKELMTRIVAAETYDWWSVEANAMIATVIMNRVESDAFPDTITEVVTQETQFETYSNGSYLTVEPNENHKEGTEKVLNGYRALGKDVLYFCTREYYDSEGSEGFFHSLNLVYEVNDTVFFTE